jgi:hypothetical protein
MFCGKQGSVGILIALLERIFAADSPILKFPLFFVRADS